MKNSRRVGLALFALGIIIFFGQRYVLGFFAMLVSMFTSPESGGYGIILQSSTVAYSAAAIMIISGAILFYQGRQAISLPSSHSQ